jgi:hypothetical protein
MKSLLKKCIKDLNGSIFYEEIRKPLDRWKKLLFSEGASSYKRYTQSGKYRPC